MDRFQQDSIVTVSGNKPPSPLSAPSNDDIEAVIQMATSSRPSPDGRQALSRDTRTQLFVGNLPYRVRWQDLKDLFRKAGTVLRADVSLGPDNRSRGYGTVLLATAEDAGRAVDMFNGYLWQTRVLEVRLDRAPTDYENNTVLGLMPSPTSVNYGGAQMVPMGPGSSNTDYHSLFVNERPKSTCPGGRNLFVGNLPFHCQWQDLKDLFRQAGSIIRADVALGVDGRSRGFGTVVLATEADAERAVKMFNGYEYNGRLLKVHYDKYWNSNQPSTNPTSPGLHSLSYADTSASFLTDPQMSLPFQPVGHSSYTANPSGYMQFADPNSGSNFPYDLYPTHHNQAHSSLSLSQPQSHSSNNHFTTGLSDSSLSINTNLSLTPPHSPRFPQNRSRPHSQHHAHPGPISIPLPPPATAFPPAPHTISPPMNHPMSQSPLHHPMAAPTLHRISHAVPMTPHGLPPITPSMPPFTFLSQPSPHARPHDPGHTHHNSATSPISTSGPNGLHTHILSPFSPGATMSPGAFFGRPGAGANPFINPAVGAPVHSGPSFFDADQGDSSASQPDEVIGYFPAVPVEAPPTQDGGYFPPMSLSSEGSRGVAEKENGQDGGGWLGEMQTDGVVLPSPLETEATAATVGPWGGNDGRRRSWALRSDGGGSDRDGGKKNERVQGVDEDGDPNSSNDAQGHSRTHSLSSPSKAMPIPANRSQTDPTQLQTYCNMTVADEAGREENEDDRRLLTGLHGLGLGLGV